MLNHNFLSNLSNSFPQARLLRVILSADEARRVKLSEEPQSVDALVDFLREKLQLQGDFSLQFEDPDFENGLCDLSAITELPSDRAILHIKWKVPTITLSVIQPNEFDIQSLGSISSLDTASFGSCPSPSPSTHPSPSQSPSTTGNMRSASVWPSPFPIPPLSHYVELRLKRAMRNMQKTKKA